MEWEVYKGYEIFMEIHSIAKQRVISSRYTTQLNATL
jgi:hypothetical protein